MSNKQFSRKTWVSWWRKNDNKKLGVDHDYQYYHWFYMCGVFCCNTFCAHFPHCSDDIIGLYATDMNALIILAKWSQSNRAMAAAKLPKWTEKRFTLNYLYEAAGNDQTFWNVQRNQNRHTKTIGNIPFPLLFFFVLAGAVFVFTLAVEGPFLYNMALDCTAINCYFVGFFRSFWAEYQLEVRFEGICQFIIMDLLLSLSFE